MMFKNFAILWSCFLFFGCNSEFRQIKELYENGSIERIYSIDGDSIRQGKYDVFYSNGRKKLTGFYKNGKFKDTINYYSNDPENSLDYQMYYYNDKTYYYKDFDQNEQLVQEGVSNKKDQRVGIWKNYDKAGNLHFVKEYKIINGEEHTNQMWVMLPSGDTLSNGVSMKHRFDKDKLTVSDSVFCFFQIDDSAFKSTDTTTVAVILPKDYIKVNFNPDFSNYKEGDISEKNIPITVHLSQDKQKKIAQPLSPNAHKTVTFYWKPKRVGKDTIRGFLEETHTTFDPNLPRNSKSDSLLTQLAKKIYFEHPIEVVKN